MSEQYSGPKIDIGAESNFASPEVFDMYRRLNIQFPQIFASFAIPQGVLAHLLENNIGFENFRGVQLSPQQLDQTALTMRSVHNNSGVEHTAHMTPARLQSLFDAFAHQSVEGILLRLGPAEELTERKGELLTALQTGNHFLHTDESVKTIIQRYKQFISAGKRRDSTEVKELFLEFGAYVKPALQSLFEDKIGERGRLYVSIIYGSAFQDLHLV